MAAVAVEVAVNVIKVQIEEQAAEAAVAAKVILAVLAVLAVVLVVEAAAVMELLVILVKLVKVEVEDLVQTKLSVVLVEKVAVKERVQMLVMVPKHPLEVVVLKVLEFAKQVELHFLLELIMAQLLVIRMKRAFHN